MEQSESPPADTREPGARRDNWRGGERGSDDPSPSLKPSRRRTGIDADSAAKVLSEVLEDVDQGVPDLARPSEQVRVIPTIPHASTPPQDAVDGAGHANGEALHTAHEPPRRVRLHQQMQMIGLNAEMQEAEGIARGCPESALDSGEQTIAAERRQATPQTERHMHRTAGIVRRPAAMWHRATTGAGLAPGSWPTPAPGADVKLELPRRRARHLDSGSIILS
jgi:hypothetical protein